jgi:hypothetical protein
MWGWVARIFESANEREVRNLRLQAEARAIRTQMSMLPSEEELRARESQVGLYGWDQNYGYSAWRDLYLRQPMGSQLVPPNMM